MIREEREKNGEVERRHSGQRRSRHRSSRTKLILFLGAGLFLETAFFLAFYISKSETEKENRYLVQTKKEQDQELEALRPQVQKLQADIATLTQSRLPDLKYLEFDTVFPIEKDYLENIVFSVSGRGEEKRYDFKILTHNKTSYTVHPRVDVFLFDRYGIQVGVARVGVEKEGAPRPALEQGEIRSFSSNIELIETSAPQYFRVKIVK